MNELINIKNNEAVTTSLKIAEVFGKQHKHVLRKIEQILTEAKNGLSDSAQNWAQCFKRSSYKDSSGKMNPMYYINRDGFAFLVMGFTGKKANEWKWKYIQAFNQMESYISFRKADIQIQKNSMQFLRDNLEMPSARDYIKANTIADKCVSTMYGFPKMLKKDDMSPQMLADREPVLIDTVELMTLNDKYDLGVSVSKNIYKKHAAIGG
jgi:Rha family phage regulatory protein